MICHRTGFRDTFYFLISILFQIILVKNLVYTFQNKISLQTNPVDTFYIKCTHTSRDISCQYIHIYSAVFGLVSQGQWFGQPRPMVCCSYFRVHLTACYNA